MLVVKIGKYMFNGAELLKYSFVFNMLLVIALFMIWRLAGDITWVWIKAWWKKRPINLEWTKNKTWLFNVPDIVKGIPEMWELDGGNRAIEVRREAVGIGPHKQPIMITVSEFPATISPNEIQGQRWYMPQHMMRGYINNEDGNLMQVVELTNEKLKRLHEFEKSPALQELYPEEYSKLKIEHGTYDKSGLWVNYPEHGIDPGEFVKHQMISTDPKLVAAYKRRGELDAKLEMYKPFHAVTDNLHYLIPLLLIFVVAFMVLQDHSMALKAAGETISCNQQLAQYRGVAPAAANLPPPNYNSSAYPTGGGIVNPFTPKKK